ncbi:CDP-alcohol phosphatidyltransferase family protein, partial [Arthrobacter sp.]|uniref:CDP-alcohol phosphatidyltransferase family protein n=1 Tax=Arthrobacter sp. TaxID=1667 RepID=UPI00258988E6
MRSVQCGPAAGLLSQLAFLSALSLAFGLGSAGWGIGLAAAIAANGLLAGAIARRNHGGLGPADWVTLLRSVLAGGAAALVADLLAAPAGGPAQRPGAVAVLVSLAFTVIALDAVDGHVARRTGTTSELGARFDMEVDAFLILVMSVYAAPKFGPWVLAIG